MSWPCPVEGCLATPFLIRGELLSHIRCSHKWCRLFKCKIRLCDASSSSYDGYRMHLFRQHVPINTMDKMPSLNWDVCEPRIPVERNLDENAPPRNQRKFHDDFFLFALRCREEYTLPKSVFQNIMFNVIELLDKYKTEIFSQANASEISPGTFGSESIVLPDLAMMMRTSQSDHLFTKVLCDHGLIKPITFGLPDEAKYQYIPILSTLQAYLSHNDVIQSIDNNLARAKDDLLHDFCDGSLFRENSFFRGDRSLLRIHLYVDDVEVCNPIGSARASHKLTCFYFVVGNVETKYLSKLRNIHPVVIVKSSVIKKLGSYTQVLKPLCNDLKMLETSGVSVTLSNGSVKHFRGSLATISADNLASHDVGGFRRSFSSGRICRFCMCHYLDLKNKFSEAMFELRSQESHVMHVEAASISQSNERAYGVRNENPFKDLLSFDVTTGLPPDIMHDILEGVIPVTLDYVINKVVLHTMTKAQLIERVQAFPYGQNEMRNKPYLTGSVSRLTASQTWCLFRHLPFIVGLDVQEQNETWELYLMLSNICDIVFATCLEKDSVYHLDVLVTEFYEALLSLDCDIIKPKFHYLLHYPRMILRYGPLRFVWSLRFESYHQRIKKISNASGNFINISYTVATRLQHRKCWEMSSPNCMSDELPPLKPTILQWKTVPNHYAGLIGVEIVSKGELSVASVNILYKGCDKYQIDDIYIVDEVLESPVFCQVQYILQWDSKWHICCKLLFSEFSRHFHSYAVKSDGFHVFHPDEIKYHRPCNVHTVGESDLIRLHNKILPVEL